MQDIEIGQHGSMSFTWGYSGFQLDRNKLTMSIIFKFNVRETFIVQWPLTQPLDKLLCRQINLQDFFSQLLVHIKLCELNLFKASMKTNVDNPHLVNPLTKLWRYFARNVHLRSTFLKYSKLAKIAIVQIIGSMEDERMF
jgi:hypothetical protein